jgi:hypothetical protein
MTTNSTWTALNNKHQENGTLTGPLIFTLPALNLVAILRLDWLDRFAETTIKHGYPLHSAVARAELWLRSIAACALVLATSSFADREVGDLGGVGKVQFESSGRANAGPRAAPFDVLRRDHRRLEWCGHEGHQLRHGALGGSDGLLPPALGAANAGGIEERRRRARPKRRKWRKHRNARRTSSPRSRSSTRMPI